MTGSNALDTAFVNLPFALTSSKSIEIIVECMILNCNAIWPYVYKSTQPNSWFSFELTNDTSTGYCNIGSTTYCFDHHQLRDYFVGQKSTFQLKCQNNRAELLSPLSLTSTYSGSFSGSGLAIGRGVGGTNVNYTNYDVCVYKIELYGQVEFQLIPVRVGQVGYMYDRVSGQLFGNQGTGSFIVGPDKN